MNGSDLGSCPMRLFGINNFDPSGSATTVLVYHKDCYEYQYRLFGNTFLKLVNDILNILSRF
jgi:hypothetical protein